jgi:hypothetical protein
MSSCSNLVSSFHLHGQDFHKLSKFETQGNKIFQFKVQNKTFNFTKEEAYLISHKGYSFILKNSIPFTIPLPTDTKYKNIRSEDIIQALEKLSLLFSTLSQVQINQSNIIIFDFLSNVLENKYLKQICYNVSKSKMTNQAFELSSKMLGEGSNEIQRSLYDFKIYVEDQELNCNKEITPLLYLE